MFHDPHVAELPQFGLRSVPLDDETLAAADCVAIVTAHSSVDYGRVVDRATLVADFRNATGPHGTRNGHVHKL
jgi:UDP-N-acetyl-D-glucosamine dehydrogenase